MQTGKNLTYVNSGTCFVIYKTNFVINFNTILYERWIFSIIKN